MVKAKTQSHYKRYTKAHQKYEKSAKGKQAREKYTQSEKGKETRRTYMRKRYLEQKELLKQARELLK